MGKTKIQWSQETWNPVVGCTRVSAGCDHCYAFQLHDQRHIAWKRGRFPTAPKQYHKPFSQVQLLPDRLSDPLRWRKPRRVFVNSMSDLFHEDVPDEFIAEVFGIMAMTPQHTYQVLTKRPERMRDWVSSHTHEHCAAWATDYLSTLKPRSFTQAVERIGAGWPWPLPNVWLGTSVEHQAAADERIPFLLQTPAAVRFLSCEPLLGPVDLTDYLTRRMRVTDSFDDAPDGIIVYGMERVGDSWERHDSLHWVIIGGESGKGARSMEQAWVESLVEQCRAAGVAPFVKQLGSVWAHEHHASDHHGGDMSEWPEHLRVREYPQTDGDAR